MVSDAQALKISTKHVALFNTFLSSYETLMLGELKRDVFTAEDMYQNLGHFKRDCPLIKKENIEVAPARRTIAIEGNDNAAPNTPKALVVEDYDWAEEIVEAKEEVNKALMKKISTGSAPLSSNFLDNKNAGIPKGNEAADKGRKASSTRPSLQLTMDRKRLKNLSLRKRSKKLAAVSRKRKIKLQE
ncbi:hypothetical protein Hanom_Chr02g00134151 [Helianthus anomalus]